jgi:hypothetical protein
MYRFRIRHPRGFALFILLSLGDLLLTRLLIESGQGGIYESNPIANFWLSAYGWEGLFLFKSLAVFLVSLVCIWISLHRPPLSAGILAFACTVTGGVVLYSCLLCFGPVGASQLRAEEECRRAEDRGRLLEQKVIRYRLHRSLMAHLSEELMVRPDGLAQAVTTLERSEKARDSGWLRARQRVYMTQSDQECLALYLMQYAVSYVADQPREFDAVAARLQAAFQALFHHPAPEGWTTMDHPVQVGRLELP